MCCWQDGLPRLPSHQEVSSYREEEVTQNEQPIPEDILQFVAEQLQELEPDNLQGELSRVGYARVRCSSVCTAGCGCSAGAGLGRGCCRGSAQEPAARVLLQQPQTQTQLVDACLCCCCCAVCRLPALVAALAKFNEGVVTYDAEGEVELDLEKVNYESLILVRAAAVAEGGPCCQWSHAVRATLTET